MALRLLGDDDLADVQEALHGCDSKWMPIGIQLKIPIEKLNKIGSQYRDSPEDCNRQMQIAWLRIGQATWKALVEALRKKRVGLYDEAKFIEDTYMDQPQVNQLTDLTGIKLHTTC